MIQPFGPVYSEVYDLIYREKDYDHECKVLDEVLLRYSPGTVRTILDLGCGTGNHALRLAAKGYHVVGVDRSGSMLDTAARKAQAPGLPVRWHEADIRSLDLGEHFDAALMMFAVLSYQATNDDVLHALQATRQHVRDGGLLVLDAWYGPAVLLQGVKDRVRLVETGQGRILRTSLVEIDIRRQLCTVRFHVWRLNSERIVSEATEVHVMRFFFPQEIDFLLAASRFELLRLGAFPDVNREPDGSTWNVMLVARAV